MTTVSEILGINYIVIAPTLALLLTVIVLLFCTITISTPMYIKKYVSFLGILSGKTLYLFIIKISLATLNNHIDPVLGAVDIQKVFFILN